MCPDFISNAERHGICDPRIAGVLQRMPLPATEIGLVRIGK